MNNEISLYASCTILMITAECLEYSGHSYELLRHQGVNDKFGCYVIGMARALVDLILVAD